MALQATDIEFSYGPRFSLRVSRFSAPNGVFVGVIGSNGCGKSTLLRILCGLERHSAGSVLLDGRPLASYTANRRARHITYVPQSHNPAFAFTVEQTVLMGRIPYRSAYGGFESADDIAEAERAIDMMELNELRSEPITTLSGGELQRVMIAKALAQRTGTIVLDEPNAHLDIAHQLSVLAIVRDHARTHNVSVIASIHDLNLASLFCDTIVAMAHGTITAQGSPAEVLRADLLHETFGADLVVEQQVYGNAPLVRYRGPGEGAHHV